MEGGATVRDSAGRWSHGEMPLSNDGSSEQARRENDGDKCYGEEDAWEDELEIGMASRDQITLKEEN